MTRADADTRTLRAGDAASSYLDAGSGPPLVLLHGIGSAAASFRYRGDADRAISGDRVGRTGLWRFDTACHRASGCEPLCGGARCVARRARDRSLPYPRSFAGHVDRRPVRGGAAEAGDQPHIRQHRQGARAASPAERQRLLAQRFDDLTEQGPHGMAAKRGPRLLGPEATATVRRMVVETMALRIRPDGYAQAAHLLATSDITADLARLPAGLPIQAIVSE